MPVKRFILAYNHNNILIIQFSKNVMDYAREIAKAGLEIGAFKINSEKPFEWASGYFMPVYNDNRMFLFNPQHRALVGDALVKEASQIQAEVIAGTSTAGIPWGERLADKLNRNFVYVRDKPKDHGLRNQIEGIDAEKGLEGKRVLLIEDLVSTGGSSVKAVEAIRKADGICNHCISIFNYEFDESSKLFRNMSPLCNVKSVLTYNTLFNVARETGYINEEQARMLAGWKSDPFNWGEKHGFPRVDKSKSDTPRFPFTPESTKYQNEY